MVNLQNMEAKMQDDEFIGDILAPEKANRKIWLGNRFWFSTNQVAGENRRT